MPKLWSAGNQAKGFRVKSTQLAAVTQGVPPARRSYSDRYEILLREVKLVG
jgi:hypothetical protein